MAFYDAKDVKGVLLPATLIYWFVGMGIIEYPIGYPRIVLSLLYSSAACTFHAICTFFAYMETKSLNWNTDSRLIKVSYVTYFGLNVFIVCFTIVVSIVCSKKRNRCIAELEDINGIIRGMGVVRTYKRFFVPQILHFGSLVFIMISTSVITVVSSKKSGQDSSIFSNVFCLQYPYFISTINEIILSNFNEIITGSFEDLNSLLESLRGITKNKLVQVNVHSNSERKIEILYSIRKLYTRLARVAKRWNQINAVFILIVVVFSVWIFTIRIFGIYIMLSLNGIRSIVETYFIAALLEIMFFSGKLIMIVRSAVSLTSEARRSCEIVLRHLHPIESLRSEVRTLSMQLTYNPLNLSVLGLCSLDYSMLQQIFTTVAAYLVMLIQTIGPLNSHSVS